MATRPFGLGADPVTAPSVTAPSVTTSVTTPSEEIPSPAGYEPVRDLYEEPVRFGRTILDWIKTHQSTILIGSIALLSISLGIHLLRR